MLYARDHPRVCGEHRFSIHHAADVLGSSPRMRGTPVRGRSAVKEMGIIPAYAGNTPWLLPVSGLARDHPRVCGEHSSSPWMLSEATGSSPRMRGTLHPPSGRQQPAGIIPAYAGNTSNTRLRVRTPRDHPRVCGEHDFDSSKFGGDLGSSPRMRGTHELFDGFGQAAGIIPAYAGNTSLLTRFSSMSQDHPRVCGEHFIEQTDAPRIVGSSPRMRGTPVLRSFRGLRMGIIPAYAGNTGRQSCRPFWRRDHPRVCGEHS